MRQIRTYGQFCPIAKSAELIGDPWSLLIVREMLLGSTRFNMLQRGLPRISPTVLSARLKQLEQGGILVRRRLNGQRGHEYRLTPAGRELSDVIQTLAVWGMRWARDRMQADDLDVSFLMFDIQRRLDITALPDGETVLCFHFPGLAEFGRWWLICDGPEVDLCHADPGKDVHCYVTGTGADMIGVWMGDIPLDRALADGRLQVVGDTALTRGFRRWFTRASAADVVRPTREERSADPWVS